MFKHYFESIHNIEIWPIISLAIFLMFFIGLIIWVLIVDKKYIKEMENLPLESTETSNHNQI
mgnify:FL=1|jgi:cytochrome c oxidase cbb3-type subunit IV